MTRYVFCGVALVVYVLGIFFGGIDNFGFIVLSADKYNVRKRMEMGH